jgi:hypothetical protein
MTGSAGRHVEIKGPYIIPVQGKYIRTNDANKERGTLTRRIGKMAQPKKIRLGQPGNVWTPGNVGRYSGGRQYIKYGIQGLYFYKA